MHLVSIPGYWLRQTKSSVAIIAAVSWRDWLPPFHHVAPTMRCQQQLGVPIQRFNADATILANKKRFDMWQLPWDYGGFMVVLWWFNGVLWWFNGNLWDLTSGKHTKNYGKSPCWVGKPTINGSFSIANCNKLPEGTQERMALLMSLSPHVARGPHHVRQQLQPPQALLRWTAQPLGEMEWGTDAVEEWSMAMTQEPIHWRYLPYIRPIF